MASVKDYINVLKQKVRNLETGYMGGSSSTAMFHKSQTLGNRASLNALSQSTDKLIVTQTLLEAI